jgi:hypothetical protein
LIRGLKWFNGLMVESTPKSRNEHFKISLLITLFVI